MKTNTPILGLAVALLAACATTGAPELPPRATVGTDAGGPLSAMQAAYDVRFYELDLEVDPEARTLAGTVGIRLRALGDLEAVELDLDERFEVTTARQIDGENETVRVPSHRGKKLWIPLTGVLSAGQEATVEIDYFGTPREAPNPPWEGGFTWDLTEDDRPWIGVSCQIDGCDLWWPCKDHPSDEPDEGAALHYTVPNGLTVVANGRLEEVEELDDGRRTWHWRVTGPINAYNITFNAAPYLELETTYENVDGGTMPFSYFVLPEHREEGEKLFDELQDHMRFLEETLGPYPFRADKYAVVETPYLAMEHQTAIAYGDAFDIQRMGFTFIALHETGHEWWGNLVSASDWRDFWLHESFDSYTEALYAEHVHGRAAYHEYIARFLRSELVNQRPVAPFEERSIREVYRGIPPDYQLVDRDAAYKGAVVLHTLRWLLGDGTFRTMLRRWAYPSEAAESVTDGSQTRITNTSAFRRHVEEHAGGDLGWFFDVYLRQPELPRLKKKIENGELVLRWNVPGDRPFPMPVEIEIDGERQRVEMPEGTATVPVPDGAEVRVDPDFWVLRVEMPDPDRFGTLGVADSGIREIVDQQSPDD